MKDKNCAATVKYALNSWDLYLNQRCTKCMKDKIKILTYPEKGDCMPKLMLTT